MRRVSAQAVRLPAQKLLQVDYRHLEGVRVVKLQHDTLRAMAARSPDFYLVLGWALDGGNAHSCAAM